MEKEPVEIGKFGFGLKLLRHPDGRVGYQIKSINEKVPIEVVIM